MASNDGRQTFNGGTWATGGTAPPGNALAGLDALDLAGRPGGGRGRLAIRLWNIVWPKVLAIALVLGVWELITLSGYKKFIWPGHRPDAGEPVGSGEDGDAVEGHWRHAAERGDRLRGRAADRRRRRRAGLPDPAAPGGGRIADHRPADDAVDRLGPVRDHACSATNNTAILFLVLIGAAPSIANGLITGVDYTPPLLLKAGTMMGLRRLSLYRYLILPASLPAFVAGLKQGWAFAWRSLMAGELVVLVFNQPSLGELLNNDQSQSDLESATAIMIVIFIIGIFVDAAVRRGRQVHPQAVGTHVDQAPNVTKCARARTTSV